MPLVMTATAIKRKHARLDIDLFDAAGLQDEIVLETAIGVLGAHLDNHALLIEEAFQDILPIAHLLEFGLSVIDARTYSGVEERIMQGFPTRPDEFASSLAAKLLRRLSLYFCFLPYPHGTEDSTTARGKYQLVERTMAALNIMLPHIVPMDSDVTVASTDTRVSSTGRRSAYRNFDEISLASRPFHELGEDVPRRREDVTTLAAKLIYQMRGALEEYLSMLRRADLRDTLKEMYVPVLQAAPTAEEDTSGAELSLDGIPPAVSSSTEGVDKSAGIVSFAALEHIQDAVNMSNARDLGPWPIYISRPAANNLRHMYKRETELFKIAMRKIKELSNGPTSWTAASQDKLNVGNQTDVPIYAAKLTGDARMIYQVDILPMRDNTEKQALKLFGIYTHAQMNKHLWESVGRSLAGKGNEYRRRCNVRRPAVGGIVLPETFPRLPDPEPLARTSDLPALSKQDLGQLQDILVLDKYYPFSQALLKSIMADMELSLVFGLSAEENEITEHTSSCYVIGRSGTGKTTTMLFRMLFIERDWQLNGHGSTKPRQLFVTKSRKLATKVEEYFLQLRAAHATESFSREQVTATARGKELRPHRLVNLDDLDSWRDDLPEKWEDLKDEHFPLFITYDKLADMLLRSSGASSQVSMHSGVRKEVVSYDTFKARYWPSFPQPLTRNLDAVSVFGEFMGVIKGSEETLAAPSRYLELDHYRAFKKRRAHVGLVHETDSIYQLYEAYSKMKRERGDEDMADRTHAILKGIINDGMVTQEGMPGRPVDFLYVDEVQDNLLIDLLVLRSLCANPRGLFWAGDTAQTISAGSTFRFNDLRAFMHRVEKMFRRTSLEEPRLFQLCVNYRSHAGIVNCAQSIVELLTHFWSHSIDILGRERGLVDGPKPVFFVDGNTQSTDFRRFLSDEDGTSLDFGAKQCIIVHDESARRRLKAQVGEVGQVLTLYESKGQEFDDVLLYNFFQDSGIEPAQWRIVLHMLPQRPQNLRLPEFDGTLHSPLCHALKTLYVAITRARKNLWIFDNPTRSEPMITLWKAKDLLDIWEPGSQTFTLATSSTEEDWATAAKVHFDNGIYDQASYCYAKAKMFKEKAIADAFVLRMHARNVPERVGSTARSNAFRKAGEAFYELLDIVWQDKDAYMRNAARCYKEGGDHLRAASIFTRIPDYTEVALCYRDAGKFDDCVQTVRHHRDRINKDIAEEIILSAARAYFDAGKDERAISMFYTPQEALDFMDKHGFHEESALFYARLGKPKEAAAAYLKKGLTLFAIEMLLVDKSETSMKEAEENLRRELWRRLSFGVVPDPNETDSRRLQHLLEEITQRLQSHNKRIEAVMFLAILSGDIEKLCLLAKQFLEANNLASALLCLDHVFTDMATLSIFGKDEAISTMEGFVQYVKTMGRVAQDGNTCTNPDLRALFSIKYSSVHGYALSTTEHTFLREIPQKKPQATKNSRNSKSQKTKPLTSALIMERLKLALSERLSSRLLHEGTVLTQVTRFSPCVSFSLFGDCDTIEAAEGAATCTRSHELVDAMDLGSYHSRARLILQRLLALENARWAFGTSGDVHAVPIEQRTVLEDLYIAVVPCFLVCKSIPALDADLVPELSEAAAVVSRWLLDTTSYPWSSPRPYGMWLRRAELATLDFILGKTDVRAMSDISPAFSSCNLEHLLRQWDVEGCNIVPVLLNALVGSGPQYIALGILYFVHIVDFELPVRVEALCDLMEYMSAVLVLTSRASMNLALHDTTLPCRSISQLAGWDCSQLNDIHGYSRIFLGAVAVVLGRLYLKENLDHIIPEHGTDDERTFFIMRICRMLGLHSHNLKDTQFSILETFQALHRRSAPRKGVAYEGYIRAQKWVDIQKANNAPPKRQDLVHLYHRQSKTGSTIAGAVRVVFDKWMDVTEQSMSFKVQRSRRAPRNGRDQEQQK